MKKCIECHKDINDEAKFCNGCGTKQPPFFTTSREQSNEKVDLAWSSDVFHNPDSDPRNMHPLEAKWRPVLDRAGVQLIGVRDIPSRPKRIKAESEWVVRTLKDNEVCEVPEKTNERIQAVEREGLVIDCWILMEEQPPPIPVPDRDYDPILVGVINIGKKRGIWCVFGRWFH